MSLFHRTSWILALGLLSGCAILPSGEEGKKPPLSFFEKSPSDRDLPELLSFYAAAGEFSEPELAKAQRTLREAMSSESCDLPRLKLGLLRLRSAGPEAPGRDSAPDDLLAPCLKADSVDPGLRALAQLIRAQLREMDGYRLLQTAGQQELDAVRKENLELRRQLEELKAIERSLQDRRRR